jgi:hypothetical protein
MGGDQQATTETNWGAAALRMSKRKHNVPFGLGEDDKNKSNGRRRRFEYKGINPLLDTQRKQYVEYFYRHYGGEQVVVQLADQKYLILEHGGDRLRMAVTTNQEVRLNNLPSTEAGMIDYQKATTNPTFDGIVKLQEVIFNQEMIRASTVGCRETQPSADGRMVWGPENRIDYEKMNPANEAELALALEISKRLINIPEELLVEKEPSVLSGK